MKLLKSLGVMIITFVIGINVVLAMPKTTDEAYEYVKNKDNGFCVYKSGNLVLGVKTNGTGKIVNTYLWHTNSAPNSIVFPLRGYEKDKCPAYAMVVGGYVGGDTTWTEAIFLSDSTSTLNDVFKDSNKYQNFEKSTSGLIYNSGAIGLERNTGIMTPDSNGNSQGSTYVDDPTGEKTDALAKVKEEYLTKYSCVYVDEANKIALGYTESSSGELYFKGVRTNNFLPPSTSKYTSGLVGEIAGQCANYAIAAQGGYEDKSLYAILRADESSNLKSSDMGIKVTAVSNVMSNIGVGRGGSSGGLPESTDDIVVEDYTYQDMNCYGLLGDPNDANFPAYWVQLALSLMRYAAIIALVGLSISDFVKAITSQNQDALKKAISTTGKRFIFAIMVFFAPIVVELIMNLFNVYGTCAL